MSNIVEWPVRFWTSTVDTFKRFSAFIGDTRGELKKVSWPDRKEVYNTTIVVIVTSFFFGFYLFVVDWALKNGIHYLTKYVSPLLRK